MSSTWTVKEKSQGELEVKIEGEEWSKAQTKALNKIVKSMKIDGFRQGQAPLAMVKKHISDNQILAEAAEMVAQKALEAGLEEHTLEPIARPTLDVPTLNNEEAVLKFAITVRPEVKLGKYKGLKMSVEGSEVKEEEIDAEINRILQNFAELAVKEGEDVKVEKGDTAVIDFEGFVDDVTFEGGKADNYPLEIGSGQFIPGFEDQLVGVKLGKSKKVKVTFPENYQNTELAGKPAVFKCKVNEIKVKQLPEMSEEIISELKIENITTPQQLKDLIRNDMAAQKKQQAENKAFDDVLEKIVKKTEVEIPDVMVQEESDHLMIEFSQRLQQSGYSIEAFMEATKQNDEDIKKQMWDDAVGRVKTRLTLEAIAKEEGIKVTPEEIDTEYERIAAQYDMEMSRVRQLARADLVGYDIVLRKAGDIVRESCK